MIFGELQKTLRLEGELAIIINKRDNDCILEAAVYNMSDNIHMDPMYVFNYVENTAYPERFFTSVDTADMNKRKTIITNGIIGDNREVYTVDNAALYYLSKDMDAVYVVVDKNTDLPMFIATIRGQHMQVGYRNILSHLYGEDYCANKESSWFISYDDLISRV